MSPSVLLGIGSSCDHPSGIALRVIGARASETVANITARPSRAFAPFPRSVDETLGGNRCRRTPGLTLKGFPCLITPATTCARTTGANRNYLLDRMISRRVDAAQTRTTDEVVGPLFRTLRFWRAGIRGFVHFSASPPFTLRSDAVDGPCAWQWQSGTRGLKVWAYKHKRGSRVLLRNRQSIRPILLIYRTP